jgi:hypothetical protein
MIVRPMQIDQSVPDLFECCQRRGAPVDELPICSGGLQRSA